MPSDIESAHIHSSLSNPLEISTGGTRKVSEIRHVTALSPEQLLLMRSGHFTFMRAQLRPSLSLTPPS